MYHYNLIPSLWQQWLCIQQFFGILWSLLYQEKNSEAVIFVSVEYAKFRGSRALMGFMGLEPSFVPLCHRDYFVRPKYFLLGISWLRIIFSRVFRESERFSRGFAVGPNCFLVDILQCKIYFLWVFCESEIFSCWHLWVQFFLVGISWAQNFFSRVQNFLLWVVWKFSVVGRMSKNHIEIYLKLRILFQIDLSNCEFYLY